ncbi:hypothetical protein A3C17_02345 [Candidatus Uhrbacteria bacterium RIFCSPHIGHO2_02_FULL_53_13]|uniref:HTH deoR-type domain-containing protein n=2 Tax=Candidatus Uhriibacteriota TaxID=1752732 RepID=A0A1F7TXQ4_9BACT|nr:MAG: hypothetical protein A3C17_02345 [Candidatus Uhrbacteria bacterium RIFCSPHIGHO2_02_FULL_53_13]OGL88996.1 MAG: hypothetical protein A3I45_01580 [Candidatus Uhrbacteria bacterium RIFCSPLOWO2_02_FULL_53_10]
MTERQQQLLKLLVDTYIKTAEPVSSQFLAEQGGFGVSSATIRNDLVALEERGYVKAPHTSAGRIPTDKGYRFYIEWFVKSPQPTERARKQLQAGWHEGEDRHLHRLMRELSDLTHTAVVISNGPDESYATGISHLLLHPEFRDFEMIALLGEMLDRRERWLKQLWKRVGDEIIVLIGDEGPFGDQIASMSLVYHPAHDPGLISLIGPVRMDYRRNLAILQEVQRMLNKHVYG